MGLPCSYLTSNVERDTFVKEHWRSPILSSMKVLQVSVKSSSEKSVKSESIPNCFTDEKFYADPIVTTSTEDDDPSAKSFNAVAILESSVMKSERKLSEKSSVLPWFSNPAHQLNTTCRLRREERSIFSRTSTQRTMTGSIASSTYVPVPMTTILPRLYLGSYDDAINEPELQAKGITHILSLIGNKSPVDYVQHENFPMHDLGRTDLKRVLKKVSKFIKLGQNDGNSVLVHCLSGQNRSPVVVIALMMKFHKNTLYGAYKKVKNLRPIIQINEKYAKQLLELEKDIFGENSLPCEWMEREGINLSTGEVAYKYEHVNSNSAQHRAMLDS